MNRHTKKAAPESYGGKMSVFLSLITCFLISLYPVKSQAAFNLLDLEKRTISIYEQAVKSVVNISNIKVKRGFFVDAVEIPVGAGSGFVWDKEGHIVTNYHVADNGSKFLITFHNDKKQYQAKFVGGEKAKDIAVLKLLEMPPSLTPLPITRSNKLKVGQISIAIGNPFGLDHSMSMGIISALGRSIDGYGGIKINNMIQTDAAVNRGNSGGPLIDSSGRLIGMNTLIYSTSGSSAGLGFAIPSDTINRIVPQITKHGKVIRPALGIGILPDNIKKRFVGSKGIVISTIQPGSPAELAGLKGMKQDNYGRLYLGDIIVKIDKVIVNTHDDIYNTLDKYKIGDMIKVHYQRDGTTKSTNLKLQELK